MRVNNLIMKKFSLIILSVLLLSCSSDDDEAATKEGNFLDVYKGVVWKYTDALDSKENMWTIFSPESFIDYGDGCEKLTSLWGVENVEGDTHTVDKNSKNLLVIISKESSSYSFTSTLTVSEDGNVMTAIYSIPSGGTETETYNKVSEACK